jgi:hypothetical protein
MDCTHRNSDSAKKVVRLGQSRYGQNVARLAQSRHIAFHHFGAQYTTRQSGLVAPDSILSPSCKSKFRL